jgi:hypothetical protein
MDDAEASERGETSPIKNTGSIAIHVREPTLRNIELAWRREPGCPNRKTPENAVGF